MPDMIDHPSLLEGPSLWETPWAILPEKLPDLQDRLGQRIDALSVAPQQPRAIRGLPSAPGRSAGGLSVGGRPIRILGGTALLPIFGPLSPRMDLLTWLLGGTPLDAVGFALNTLVADPEVKTIVLVIDSPGGSVYGIEELASEIFQARGQKRIVALADPFAASAAYWLAAQAGEVLVTPSGMVGSVGVIAMHRDVSGAEQKAGVKTTTITAGQYKAEGSPFEPLSAEARAYIQQQVDEYHGMFVDALARGRRVSTSKVREDFGKGRMLTAPAARAQGMVDRIDTLDGVIEANQGAKSGLRAAAVIERFKAGYKSPTRSMIDARLRALEVERIEAGISREDIDKRVEQVTRDNRGW